MKYPRFLRSKAFSLLLCVIMPFFLFACLGGKSVENNTISQRWENTSKQKDSVDSSKERLRTMGTYAHDSIYNSDSIVVIVRNDTVLRDRWHFRTTQKIKFVYLTDTLVKKTDIYHYKTDTLKYYVTKTKYKYKEKQLSWWQDAKMKLGGLSILASFIFAALYGLERARCKDAQNNK